MKDKENKLNYVKVSKDNYELAYNIQKQIWVDEPDYENFKNKSEKGKLSVLLVPCVYILAISGYKVMEKKHLLFHFSP